MNVADTLRAGAARDPGAPALTSDGERWSFAELDAAVDRVAAGLVGVGCRPGDRVAVVGRNTPAFVRNLYGVLRAGAVAVPTSPELSVAELDHVLTDSGTGLVLARSAPPALREAVGRTAGVHELITDDGADGTRVLTSLPGMGAAGVDPTPGEGADPAPPVGADDPALLQYTAGTTGRPKGAVLTHGNMLANGRQLDGTRVRVTAEDRVLGVLPMWHVYGLGVALLYPLARGASVHLVERFRSVESLAAVSEHGITVVPGAPPVFMAWVAAVVAGRPVTADLSGVRAAVSGASALPVETWLSFRDHFGVEIWQGYGLTEAAPVVTTTAVGDDALPGSIGRPLPGVEVRLRDEGGGPVHAGDPGEILVRGPNVFAGYWNEPEATRAVVDAEGWLHTGDIAYVEDDNLYLVDRKTDLVIMSGFNVYPKEVEDALRTHPAVEEAAVVGRPDARTGERVVAYVTVRDDDDGVAPDPTALRNHARSRLARFKWPEEVHVVAALPHLLTGKVARRQIREWGPS